MYLSMIELKKEEKKGNKQQYRIVSTKKVPFLFQPCNHTHEIAKDMAKPSNSNSSNNGLSN